MRALAGESVLGIERAFVLIDHYPVGAQRLEAVAVKLAGEQSFARSERIGGIHYYEVVLGGLGAHETHTVLKMRVHAFVVQPAGCEREILAADVRYFLVDVHEVDALYVVVTDQLAARSAVAAAYDEHVADVRVHRHRDVRYHFVIDELVLFRQHHIAVEDEKPPEFGRIEHVYALKIAAPAAQLFIHFYRELDVFGVFFGKPQIH